MKRPLDPHGPIQMTSNASDARALAGGDPGPARIIRECTVKPTLIGPHGKAWLCDMDALRVRLKASKDQDSTIAAWLIEAPWAHPVWHSYFLYLIHLRPLPGFDLPPVMHLPMATHELVLWAMDPDAPRNEIVIGQQRPGEYWLSPKQFGAQICEITDELAQERVQKSVQEIIDGKLSPDTDAQRDWIKRYGDNMIKPEWRR